MRIHYRNSAHDLFQFWLSVLTYPRTFSHVIWSHRNTCILLVMFSLPLLATWLQWLIHTSTLLEVNHIFETGSHIEKPYLFQNYSKMFYGAKQTVMEILTLFVHIHSCIFKDTQLLANVTLMVHMFSCRAKDHGCRFQKAGGVSVYGTEQDTRILRFAFAQCSKHDGAGWWKTNPLF